MVKLKLVCIAELCTMPRKKSSGLSGNGPGAKANTPRSTAEDEEEHLCHMPSPLWTKEEPVAPRTLSSARGTASAGCIVGVQV